MLIHGARKPFMCDLCGKTYHQRSHSGEKPFVCDVCGKRFFHAASLKQHERIHTGEKPYKCDQCGKAFVKRRSLRTHQSVHRGKMFTCETCGLRSPVKSSNSTDNSHNLVADKVVFSVLATRCH
uniref:C2H2-type domain-containing protein n=1 Tax=Stegastes partitus TaxID=144197 RepID=A0A3B5AGN2_9TELE